MFFRRSSPGAQNVAQLDEYDVWPFKHRHWQFEIIEDARHDCWISTGDLRDFWPLLPDDRTLVQRYGKAVLYDRSTRRHYAAERIMKLEMRRRRPDNDRTDLLRWLEAYDHNVGKVMARKRANRHFDERQARQEELESTVTTHGPSGPGQAGAALGPAPPSFDASTQPLGSREKWQLQRAPDEPERVFRPEALPLRVSWASHWGGLARDVVKATAGLFAGLQPPVRTGLLLAPLAFATQAWMSDLLVPDDLDVTRHGSRLLWSAFALALLGLGWALAYVVALTRSTWRTLPHAGSRLLLVGFWGLMISLTPGILLRNLAPGLVYEWWEWVHGKAQPIEVVADEHLGRIVARGEIRLGSANALEAAIRAHPGMTLLQLDSPGGFVVEGMRMAQVVQEHHLDTYTRDLCASACTFVMVAGAERYLSEEGRLGFHRSALRFQEFDGGWSSTDHMIARYFRSRGIPEDFIQQALKEPMWRVWWAPPRELFASGYITAWWADRPPGY